MAPAVGIEPTTFPLTAECSTSELHRNSVVVCVDYYCAEGNSIPRAMTSGETARIAIERPLMNFTLIRLRASEGVCILKFPFQFWLTNLFMLRCTAKSIFLSIVAKVFCCRCEIDFSTVAYSKCKRV
jgi:hypothetical protein